MAEIALTEYLEGVFQQQQIAAQGELATAQDELSKAENRLERTQRARKRLNDLRDPQVGPKTPADIVAELEIDDRLDAAEAAVKREKLAVERAESRRTVLERFTRAKTTKELGAKIEKARSDESTKKQIQELEQRKAQRLRTQIANCKVLAPRDGLVVYATDQQARALGGGMGGLGGGMGGLGSGMGGLRGGMGGLGAGGLRAICEGEAVHERQKIFSIPIGPFSVMIATSRAVAERLAVGNSARIKPNGMPGEVLDGVVEAISGPGTAPPRRGFGFGGPAALNAARQQFGGGAGNLHIITVKIDNAPPGLGPDQFAEAEILAGERDGIVTVPRGAVVHGLPRDGDHIVIKKPNGTFELRDVTLGAANDRMTEILQGLESGESIVLDPANVNDEPLRQRIRNLERQGGFQ